MRKRVKFKTQMELMLNEVQNKDYANIVGNTVKVAWEKAKEKRVNSLNEIEKLYKFMIEYDESSYKVYNYVDINISPDQLLFLEGDKKDVYKQQSLYTQYAALCYETKGYWDKGRALVCENVRDFLEENYKQKSSVVRLYCGECSDKKMEVICNSGLFAYPSSLTKKDLAKGVTTNLKEYNTAIEGYKKLNSEGIHAKVYNYAISEAVKDFCDDEVKKYKDKAEEIRDDASKNLRVWKFADIVDGFLKYLLWIFGALVLFFGFAAGIMWSPALAVSLDVIGILMLISVPIIYKIADIYGDHFDKTSKVAIQHLVDEINKHCNYDKLMNLTVNISNSYYATLVKLNDKAKAMHEEINKKDIAHCQAYNNATAFLPKNLNRALLPKAAELLKTGVALDLNTALWQAEQSRGMNKAFNEYNDILKAMQQSQNQLQNLRQNLNEIYRQHQLDIQKEQLESQKRAEEYAKQQAEYAQRQAEAAAAAAKAAEKQAENSEELLRRSTDPYYINQWKNNN